MHEADDGRLSARGVARGSLLVPSLENRFGPFRSDEGSNPSPSSQRRRPTPRCLPSEGGSDRQHAGRRRARRGQRRALGARRRSRPGRFARRARNRDQLGGGRHPVSEVVELGCLRVPGVDGMPPTNGALVDPKPTEDRPCPVASKQRTHRSEAAATLPRAARSVPDGYTARRHVEPPLLTVADVASYLSVSKSAVYRALEEGRLPGTKILGRWRTSWEELLEWRGSHRRFPGTREASDPMPRPGRRGSFRSQVTELNPRRRT